jgi:hypothetical protein
MMRQQLTENDIKEIRNQCRMGIIIPVLFLILSNMILFLFILEGDLKFDTPVQIAVFALVLASALIHLLMNRKLILDIRNGEKEVEFKRVQLKDKIKDFEAGSGTLTFDKEMNEFDRYNLIIENCAYRVDKEIFEQCQVGEEVAFFIAPISKYQLQIDLKKNVGL